jgi:tRNA nucleotidyltransferase (CCA-adding enzyme)
MEYSVGTVIFDNQVKPRKVLLIKQKNSGHIGFPKGHIEDNESFEQTALRETFEEVGLEVILSNHYKDIFYTLPNGKNKKVTYFMAYPKQSNIKIQEEEIIFAHYYNFDEALSLLTYQNDKDVLKQFINIIKEANL